MLISNFQKWFESDSFRVYLDLFASLCLRHKPACQEGIGAGDVIGWGAQLGSTRSAFGSEIIEYFHYSLARLLLG